MDYSFPHYLLAKQTVDDRALNRQVYEALTAGLPPRSLRILEVGAGIGTMLARLLRWGMLMDADYILVDQMEENIAYALDWLPGWVEENLRTGPAGPRVERSGANQLRILAGPRDVRATFVQADVFDFIERGPDKADLLIAHALLDLLPLDESLPKLFSSVESGGLAWLTANFDGVTALEPALDPELDAKIERLFHESMDIRPSGGDSRTGRHLFGHLGVAGAEILVAGASDWVVFPRHGSYPAEEAYFLQFILHFFETSLAGHPDLAPAEFDAWLAERRAQVERGELVYIAHQMDFLVKIPPAR
jgi:SAM-dependent methyltransferase